MVVTLEEMKAYLRVDFPDEDDLIGGLLLTAENICMDVARLPDEAALLADADRAKTAVMYAAAFLYEHREEADHRELMLTLRALLSGIRREEF